MSMFRIHVKRLVFIIALMLAAGAARAEEIDLRTTPETRKAIEDAVKAMGAGAAWPLRPEPTAAEEADIQKAGAIAWKALDRGGYLNSRVLWRCTTVVYENQDGSVVTVAWREYWLTGCPGEDPEIAFLIARMKVDIKTGAVMWDPKATEKYVPLPPKRKARQATATRQEQ